MSRLIRTLNGLIHFCGVNDLPLDQMRFALGRDMGNDPCWFYVYQDEATGEWVVAKNKNDGTRVERYRGPDEEEAVNIIMCKMRQEAEARGLYLRIPSEAPSRHTHWDEPDDIPPTVRRYRRRQKLTHVFLHAVVPILIFAAIVLTLLVIVRTLDTSGGDRATPGRRNEVITRDPEPASDWSWLFAPSYDYGYDYGYDDPGYDYDPGYDDPDYGYDYGYDDPSYGYDDPGYDYDDSWSYDSGDSWDNWDSGDTDWSSDWDSDYDSGYDSWDSGDTDWSSDW